MVEVIEVLAINLDLVLSATVGKEERQEKQAKEEVTNQDCKVVAMSCVQ